MNRDNQCVLIDIMNEKQCSAASALAALYPELNQVGTLPQSEADKIILVHMESKKTIGKSKTQEVADQLIIPIKDAARLLNGLTPKDIERIQISKEAKEGGKELVQERIAGVSEYLESNIRHLVAGDFYGHVAPSLNSVMKHPELSAAERFEAFMKENEYSSNDIAWIAYSSNHINPHYGVATFIKTLVRKKLNITLPVKALISESALESDPSLYISDEGKLFVEISNKTSPLELHNQADELSTQVSEAVDAAISKAGYKDWADFITQTQPKRVSRSQRSLKKSFAFATSTTSPKAVAKHLDLFNRFLKCRNLHKFHQKQKLYRIKYVYLQEALSSGAAKITSLIKRPNPYMLDCGDITYWDDVIAKLERRFKEGQHTESMSNLFASLAASGVIAIDDERVITPTSDVDAYRTALILALIKSSKDNLALALYELYESSRDVLECFNTKALKAKQCSPKNARNMFDRHFDETYMDVWEIDFCGYVFHLPASIAKIDPSTAPKINYKSADTKFAGSLTAEEQDQYNFDDVARELYVGGWIDRALNLKK